MTAIRTARHSVAPKPMARLANLVTASAVALSLILASAVPVRAGGRDDLTKALIAALVIGAIVSSTRRSGATPPPVDVPEPQPVRRPRLPSVCAIEIDQGRRAFSERCLDREGFDHPLPSQCGSDVRVHGRWDTVYGARCLRDAGYRVSGR